MSPDLILFPNYSYLMGASNTSAFLTTHSVLLEWLYDTCILGRGYNRWFFSKSMQTFSLLVTLQPFIFLRIKYYGHSSGDLN